MLKYTLIFLLLLQIGNKAKCQNDEALKKLSFAFINHLIDKEYQNSMNLCTDRMQNAISAEELGRIWEGLDEQLGGFVDTGRVIIKEYKGNSIVYTKMNYNKLPVYFQLTIDSTMKVAGFFYQLDQKSNEWRRPDYVDYNRIKTYKTSVVTDEYEMNAELTLPKTIGPFPAVVLVHGSGPNDMDGSVGSNKPLKDIAMGLSSNGIAVLRYDKRTFSHPVEMAGEIVDINSVVLDDVKSAIKLLKRFNEVDTSELFVAGHSLGAMMAPKIAEDNPSLKGILMLAPPARDMLEMIKVQLLAATIRNNQNGDTASNKEIGATLKEVFQLQLEMDGDDNATSENTAILGVPYSFWKSLNDYNQVEVAKNLNLPILLLHAKKDQQVFRQDLEIWQSSLKDKENVSIKTYEELNHLFIPSSSPDPEKDYQNPSNVEFKVIEDMANWVKTH